MRPFFSSVLFAFDPLSLFHRASSNHPDAPDPTESRIIDHKHHHPGLTDVHPRPVRGHCSGSSRHGLCARNSLSDPRLRHRSHQAVEHLVVCRLQRPGSGRHQIHQCQPQRCHDGPDSCDRGRVVHWRLHRPGKHDPELRHRIPDPHHQRWENHRLEHGFGPWPVQQ